MPRERNAGGGAHDSERRRTDQMISTDTDRDRRRDSPSERLVVAARNFPAKKAVGKKERPPTKLPGARSTTASVDM
jgi:hypothetical protein